MTSSKRKRRDSRRKKGGRGTQGRRPPPAREQRPQEGRRSTVLPALLAPLAAGLVSVAVASLLFFDLDGGDTPAPPQVAALAPAAPAPGQPPDLSTMTPREAADRLYNRIMMASEQGRPEEAQQFVPMALAAYRQLASLDADAHYHLGRIHAEAGDIESVRLEIDAMRRLAPDHLLAAVLEHLVAEAAGDPEAMARAYATFAAAYDAEMAAGRPEYEHHRITIDQFRVASYGAKPELQISDLGDAALRDAAVGGPGLGSAATEGAERFAKHCAVCHGPNAAGSNAGPPLVHKIYEPGHHDNGAFYRAVRQGVRAHHWSFGDMPPVPGVSDRDLGQIVAYVRALQVAQGIR